MSQYHGDIRLGDTIDIKFCTATTTGAPTQLAGTPVISAYPGNSTTQITAGITLTVDFDTVTGLNNVRVVATSGNGYATATNYALVITTGTVGGTSAVGYVIGSFSIENRSALMPTTAARTLDVSSTGEAGVDWANVGSPTTSVSLSGTTVATVTTTTTATNLTNNNDKTGYSLTATTGLGNQTANITGNLSGSVGSVTGAVGSVTGAVGSVTAGVTLAATATSAQLVDDVWDEVLTGATHNVASSAGRRLRTASGGQIDAGTAQAGSSDTLTLATSASTTEGLYVGCAIVIDGGTGVGQSRYIIGYTTGRVAAVARPWTTTPDGTSTYVLYADNQIDFLQLGLAQAGGASSITLSSGASATDNIYNGHCVRVFGGTGKYQVRTISAYDGTTKVATVDRAWQTNPDSTSYYGVIGLQNNLLPDQAFDLTGNITGNLSGSVGSVTGLTNATIADQVWDEAIAGHLGAGSTGEALNAAGAAGDPWVTALPGAYGAGSAGYIVGTNLDAPVGTVDTVVDAIKAKTDSLNFTVAGEVDANIQSINDTAITGDGSGTPFNV